MLSSLTPYSLLDAFWLYPTVVALQSPKTITIIVYVLLYPVCNILVHNDYLRLLTEQYSG